MIDDFDPYYEWLGISPDHRPLNHYLLLGLAVRESDRKRISNAADQRVAYLRSFQQGKRAIQSQQLLNEVAAAVSCLLNVDSKSAYDASLPPSALTARPNPPPTLSMSALSGPMAPVGAQSVPEPAAPPLVRSVAAQPSPVADPPVARPVDAAELVAPPKTMQELEDGHADDDEAVEPTSRLFIAALVIAATALLASGMLGLLAWMNWLGAPDVDVDVPPPTKSATEATADADPKLEETVAVVQEGDGGLRLSPSFAQLGDGLELGDVDGDVVVLNWSSEEQSVAWRVRLVKPGVFEAKVTYATLDEKPAGTMLIEVGGKTQQLSLRGSGGPEVFVSETFYLAIPKFGVSTINLRPSAVQGENFVSLKSLELQPQH